jgi:hypothetical protein
MFIRDTGSTLRSVNPICNKMNPNEYVTAIHSILRRNIFLLIALVYVGGRGHLFSDRGIWMEICDRSDLPIVYGNQLLTDKICKSWTDRKAKGFFYLSLYTCRQTDLSLLLSEVLAKVSIATTLHNVKRLLNPLRTAFVKWWVVTRCQFSQASHYSKLV